MTECHARILNSNSYSKKVINNPIFSRDTTGTLRSPETEKKRGYLYKRNAKIKYAIRKQR